MIKGGGECRHEMTKENTKAKEKAEEEERVTWSETKGR